MSSRRHDSRENGRRGSRDKEERKNDTKHSYLTFDYTWSIAIDNMAQLLTDFKVGECHKSPKFVTRTNGQRYVWQIELYPNGFHKDHAGWMSLFLVMVAGPKPSVRGNYVVDVVDRNLAKKLSEESNETEFLLDEGVGHSRYLRLDLRELRSQGLLQASNLLVFDYMLNLHADAFKKERAPSRGNSRDRERENDENRRGSGRESVDPELAERFKDIERPRANGTRGGGHNERDRGDSNDYDIRVMAGDGGKFYCHSTEVKHASNVLRDIAEQVNDGDGVLEIEIESVPTASVREVLRYVYTGQAQLSPQSRSSRSSQPTAPLDMVGICNVAEQWDLPGLLKDCTEYMSDNLTAENAADTFICAADYNLGSALKQRAATEILANMQGVVKSEGWSKLAERPKLITHLFASGPLHEAAFIGLDKKRAARPQTADDVRRQRPDQPPVTPRDPYSKNAKANSSSYKVGRITYTRQGRH